MIKLEVINKTVPGESDTPDEVVEFLITEEQEDIFAFTETPSATHYSLTVFCSVLLSRCRTPALFSITERRLKAALENVVDLMNQVRKENE